MENREKILNAALELFTEDGFQVTTTAKIAEKAGVSNGTLFYYFNTKDTIITSLYLWKIESFKNDVMSCLSDIEFDKHACRNVWYACLQWYLKNKQSFLFFNIYKTMPGLQHLRITTVPQTFTLLEKIFEDFKHTGLFIDIPVLLLVNSFYGSIISIFNFMEEYEGDSNEYLEVSFEMWWRSVSIQDKNDQLM